MSSLKSSAAALTEIIWLDRISSIIRLLAVFVVTLASLSVWHSAIAQQQSVSAGTSPPLTLTKMDDVQSGGLLLKSKYSGYYLDAPALATDVDIDINGLIARTTVTQRFENPSNAWVEGVYVFPLPDMSAVDTLRLKIGERYIEGEIKERQEARRVYEAARSAGQRASLVEQERPNMFTNSVANIGPGETISVQITYQETIRYDDGKFHLRFPMVVGPRFIPPAEVQLVSFNESQSTEVHLRDPVPDADRITPPVLHPTQGQRNPITLTVHVDAGFPINGIKGAHHDIKVKRTGSDLATITLARQNEVANRDFELVWQSKNGAVPQTAVFEEVVDGKTFVAGFIIPPADSDDSSQPSRETIFVIDNSGSMGGASIRQAKESLLFALKTLAPGDRFNVIRFDDTTDSVFPSPQPVAAETLSAATRYINRLEAEGGTMMLPALQSALYDPHAAQEGDTTLRQVIFLTDGSIGNEAQLFEEIDRSLGRSRLFTVGIGSAPNSYFMTRAARLGRGTFTHIGSERQVTERMSVLLSKLKSPVMTDISVTSASPNAAEVWPNPLPDLYAGEPIIFTAMVDNGAYVFDAIGKTPNKNWLQKLSAKNAKSGVGIAKIWARNKIASIEELRFQGANQTKIDSEVLQVALAHHLVTRLTSLVAVDKTPARPSGAQLLSQPVPLNLPEGWDFDKVFGDSVPSRRADLSSPQTQTVLAALQSRAAAPTLDTPPSEQGIVLPQGSTDKWLLLIIGMLCMIGGLVMAALQWREITAASGQELF